MFSCLETHHVIAMNNIWNWVRGDAPLMTLLPIRIQLTIIKRWLKRNGKAWAIARYRITSISRASLGTSVNDFQELFFSPVLIKVSYGELKENQSRCFNLGKSFNCSAINRPNRRLKKKGKKNQTRAFIPNGVIFIFKPRFRVPENDWAKLFQPINTEQNNKNKKRNTTTTTKQLWNIHACCSECTIERG